MIAEKLSDNILLGRKCFYCRNYGLYRLKDKRLKCKSCKAYYSLNKLRKDLRILYFFYLELSARKAAKEIEISYNSVLSRFMFYRRMIADHLGKEFSKLYGELETDESYFGGKRKGKRGRGANNKAIVFGIVSRLFERTRDREALTHEMCLISCAVAHDISASFA